MTDDKQGYASRYTVILGTTLQDTPEAVHCQLDFAKKLWHLDIHQIGQTPEGQRLYYIERAKPTTAHHPGNATI
jgi:hypothetical protein